MNFLYKITIICYGTITVGILYNGSKISFIQYGRFIITKYQLNTNRRCPRSKHFFCLCKNVSVNIEFGSTDDIRFIFLMEKHGHGFCCSRGFVEQTCISKFKPR